MHYLKGSKGKALPRQGSKAAPPSSKKFVFVWGKMHNFRPLSILRGGGGYLVQKTLRGCAANMGSKISLLVYEWTLIKCKIWYMNGSIFQKFPKFGKIGWFCSNFGQKLDRLVYEWVTFSWKLGICMGLLSNSVAAHPYQNQTWVPPGGILIL